jgi:MIP family channel proteins
VESTWRAAVAEFVGTFALVFVAAGSAIVAGPSGSGLLGEALAYGFVVATMTSLTAHTSGGHLNPAVTVGVWVTGRISTLRAITYGAAQVAGGVLGGLLLRLVVPEVTWRAASLGTPLLAPRVGTGKGIAIEAVLTFFLAFAMFATALDDRGVPRMAGAAMGLVIAFDVLAAGPLTGASANPARAFGPELVSGTWANWWIYWAGPLAGAAIASVLYWSVFLRERQPAAP